MSLHFNLVVQPRFDQFFRFDRLQPAPLLGWSNLSNLANLFSLTCAHARGRARTYVTPHYRYDRLDRFDQPSNGGAFSRSNLS